MEICYHLLGIGKQATQREIFYKIVSNQSTYVNCQNQVNNAIQGKLQGNRMLLPSSFLKDHCMTSRQTCWPDAGLYADVVAVLLCTRRSLGIVASSKGLVAGRLVIEVKIWSVRIRWVFGPLIVILTVLGRFRCCTTRTHDFFEGAWWRHDRLQQPRIKRSSYYCGYKLAAAILLGRQIYSCNWEGVIVWYERNCKVISCECARKINSDTYSFSTHWWFLCQ